ncbi:hypothetical protein P7C71_g924, partial [Lecanoromycetidae sp. Uapishka_2]
MYRKPYAFYLDRGQHFDNEELREFLRHEGIAIDYSPSGSSNSTGMVEVSNRLVEDVLRKQPPSQAGLDWDRRIPKAAQSVNSRTISYLGISPTGILFGPMQETSAAAATLLALPGRDVKEWASKFDDPAQHAREVQLYVNHRAEVQDVISRLAKDQKEKMAEQYNKGVRQVIHKVGSKVMLHQKDTKKLQARWRGPFQIDSYAGTHGLSFSLR